MLAAVNAARASARSCGSTAMAATGAVSWSKALENAAIRHASDMAANNWFSHTGTDGSSVGSRAIDAGYRYSAIAENIAAGYGSVNQVMSGWLSSSGHCKAIMTPRFQDLGVACRMQSGGRTNWSMELGVR
ncbi:hypothetical protein NBRC116584_26580 [Hydrogenophaga sp. 5NK40-0174]